MNGQIEEIPFNNIPIIAADGAYDKLINNGIQPQIVIGDLDSIQSPVNKRVKLIQHYDQDLCDFEKCLLHIISLELWPCLVVGGYGYDLDHCFNNMAIFARYSKKITLTFYAHKSWTKFISKSLEFETIIGKIISILPYPSAVISTKGLNWELNLDKLDLFSKSSARNIANQAKVSITVHSGNILLITSHDFQV